MASELQRQSAIDQPRAVLVGVVPPPFHGQSLATEALFEHSFEKIHAEFVEVCSSKNLEEVGKASLSKFLRIFPVVVEILRKRFRSGATVLYYCAGSASWVPFIRDLIILGIVRVLFRQTVIHFHSGGMVDFLQSSPVLRFLGQLIYGRGSWSIVPSALVQVPDSSFGVARVVEVLNGIEEPASLVIKTRPLSSDSTTFIFLGNLYEDKGVFVFLEAAKKIASREAKTIILRYVGGWPDQSTRVRFEKEVSDCPPNLVVESPQTAYGDEKWDALNNADVFVFPTYYRSENLPLCVIEAMACALPVISTEWRGVPSLVDSEETGFLVPVKDADSLANAMNNYLQEPEKIASHGMAGRKKFESHFRLAHFIAGIENCLLEASEVK